MSVTRTQDVFSLGGYNIDIALAKRRAGDTALFNAINQIQAPSASLDSSAISDPNQAAVLLRNAIGIAQVIWRLNANPFVKIVAGFPAQQFTALIDFPAFAKNGVLGIRFQKEQINQVTPWMYGVTQYAVPRLEAKRANISIEAYGLLFEASRRHQSRNFKNTTAKSILGIIAKKYNLGFTTVGPLEDTTINEVEQNFDDLALLRLLAIRLNAFWYLEGSNLILIGREQCYTQKPEVTLVYGRSITEDIDTEFPISEFFPLIDGQVFEAGAERITARGIDLDTGDIVEQVFEPQATRLGPLSFNSSKFHSDEGVTINDRILRPAPKFQFNESGIFLPLRPRSDDAQFLRYEVEHKDIEVRAVVTCPGIPRLKPGNVVRVDGVGELFGGNWVIEEIAHMVGQGKGYESKLILMRNAFGQINVATPFKTNLKQTQVRSASGVRQFAEPVNE